MTIQLKFLTSQTQDCLVVVDRYLKKAKEEFIDGKEDTPSEELRDEKEMVLSSLSLYRTKLRLMNEDMRADGQKKQAFQTGFNAALAIIAKFENEWKQRCEEGRLSQKDVEKIAERCMPVLTYMRHSISKGDAPQLTTSKNYTFNAEIANGVMSTMMLQMNHKTPERVNGWKANEKQVKKDIMAQAESGRNLDFTKVKMQFDRQDEDKLYTDARRGEREMPPSLQEQLAVVEKGRREWMHGHQEKAMDEHLWG